MKRSSSNNLNNFQEDSSNRQSNGAESDINMLDAQLAEIIFKFVPMCQWSSLEYVSEKFRHCVKLAYGRVKFINLKSLFSLSNSTITWTCSSTTLLFPKSGMTDRLDKILKKLLAVCPNLKGISGFEYITRKMDAQSTWNILLKFHRLQSLSLEIELKFCHLAYFVANCKSLKMLTISRCYFNSDDTLNVGKLTSLICGNVQRMKPIFLENLSENLTTLRIDGLSSYFKPNVCVEKAMKVCVNLESLAVTLDDWRDKEILVNILPNLSKLTSLYVWCIDNLNLDENFCVQLDLIKSQLKSVKFHYIELSDEVQQFLFSKCVRLESLRIRDVSSIALKKLTNLPGNLKQLAFLDRDGQILPLLLPSLMRLSNFVDLTIYGYGYTTEWENLCCLVSLKNLCVYGGCVDDSLLEKWNAKNDKMFENMVVLKMSRSAGVSDAGALFFAKKAINLKILQLAGSKISAKTISVLADVAKKLTTVDVVYSDQLVDGKAILNLIEKAKSLKKLRIDEKLWKKLACLNGFIPFIEDVEIEPAEEFDGKEFDAEQAEGF